MNRNIKIFFNLQVDRFFLNRSIQKWTLVKTQQQNKTKTKVVKESVLKIRL